MQAGDIKAGFNRWTRIRLSISGVAFGVVTSAVNHGFGPGSAYVSKILGNGWTWLAVGMLACLAAKTWKIAFLRGLAFYLAAVGGYYLSDVAAGVYSSPPFADLSAPPQFDVMSVVIDLGFYVLLSTVTSCLLAALVTLARRGGLLGVVAAAAVPGYIAVNALLLHRHLRTETPATDAIAIQMTWLIGASALIVTVGVVVIRIRILLRRQHASRGTPSFTGR